MTYLKIGSKQNMLLKVYCGPRGPQGEKGEKPVKGIDYWTDEDKTIMAEDLTEYLPVVTEEEVTRLIDDIF